MGYCSDVAVVCGSKFHNELTKFIPEYLTPTVTSRTIWESHPVYLLEWDYTKWYGTKIDEFMRVIRDPEDYFPEYDETLPEWGYKFVRIGEEFGDEDSYGNDYGYNWYTLYPNAVLDFGDMDFVRKKIITKNEIWKWFKDNPTTDPLNTEEICRTIVKCLTELSAPYAKAATILDYCLPDDGYTVKTDDSDYYYPQILIGAGGSEGIYVDWNIATKDRTYRIGTLKTLREDTDAYRILGEMVGLLTVATELYMGVYF